MVDRPGRGACSVLLLLALPAGCGADAIIALGQTEPLPKFGDSGRRVNFINQEDEDEDNPTLTEDLLQIYFTSSRSEGPDGDNVWFATRASRADPFGAPLLVDAVNSEDEETSPAISPDGLTLYVGSNRPGGSGDGDIDIWRTTRPSKESEWGALVYVEELNTESDDIPRPLALGGLAMPMASRRDRDDYQTYLATRPALDAAFDTLTPLSELWVDGAQMVDAFMTDDGMMLFFNREENEDEGELYMAWRTSLDEPFGPAVPVPAVNTPNDERDPWLSPDGKRFFFSSDRRDGGDGRDIYATSLELPRFEP